MTFETTPSFSLSEFRTLLHTTRLPAQEIAARTREIYQTMLAESRCLRRGNFTAIETADLRRLFEQYDQTFFHGKCGELVHTNNTLRFRLSKRMTSAAGKTFQRRPRHRQTLAADYEIAISTTLLFETFNEELRPITVSGVSCGDRLEALQRIFEHEMLHLLEMLLWDQSSCSADRFRSIAHRFFGHSQSTHQLITPREIAQTKYGIAQASGSSSPSKAGGTWASSTASPNAPPSSFPTAPANPTPTAAATSSFTSPSRCSPRSARAKWNGRQDWEMGRSHFFHRANSLSD